MECFDGLILYNYPNILDIPPYYLVDLPILWINFTWGGIIHFECYTHLTKIRSMGVVDFLHTLCICIPHENLI